jgi:hypothetical protein
MAKKQTDTVYKVVEVVGVSEEVVGGRRPRCGGNGSRHAARLARGRGDADGHEVGKRQGFRVSHPSVTVLQI